MPGSEARWTWASLADRALEKKRLAGVAILWFVFALVPEFVVNSPRPLERGAGGGLVFGLTAIASLCTWWLLAVAIAEARAKWKRAGWIPILLVGPVGVFCTVGSIHYKWFFGTDVRPIAVAYFLQNPGYALGLVGHSMTPATTAGLFGGAAFGVVALSIVTMRPFARSARPPRWTIALVVAAISLVSIPAAGYGKYPCIAEVRGVRALLLGLYSRGLSEKLHALPIPHRIALAHVETDRRPDVVLVIHESLGASRMAPWNGQKPTPGGLMEMLERHGEHTVTFPDAISIAPVTAVSVPSTLSGLAPDSDIGDFEHAPLVWHEARARGYRTAFFSAQDFNVDFFQGFYLSDGGPDEARNANDHPGLPRVNDRGVRDSEVVDEALDFAARAPVDQPILIVLQMNATHWPCWSPDLAEDAHASIPERCEAAVRYVDGELGRLAEGLARSRDFENTLLVGTSDHGENFDPSLPARAVNYYQGVLRVPLFVHLPERVVESEPDLLVALRENRNRRVANFDVLPTLLDVWRGGPLAGDRPALAGTSLVRPVPGDRLLLAIAETAIWDSIADGFAVFDGRWKWIIDEFHGARLYDLEADPTEEHDLASLAPASVTENLVLELRSHPRALEICRRVAPSLAPPD